MGDFSHLKALEVTKEKTAEFILHQITVNGKTPTLTVTPATDANKPYFNALLKRAGKAQRAIRAGSVNASMLEENRDDDRGLFAEFIIKGWEGMIDGKTGKETPFSKDECQQFLTQLPDWLFDDIRNFCGSPANFTDSVDIEVTAKN